MTAKIQDILEKGKELECSDIFLLPGSPICVKKNGIISPLTEERLMPDSSELLVRQIYELAGRSIHGLLGHGDDDFSISLNGVGRFRCNVYKQRSSLAAVIRIVSFELPDSDKMHIPDVVMDLWQTQNGLILVTGPAGSGKSTTLACLIDKINQKRNGHIITLEDPIEYIHAHQQCLVSQREVLHDTESYTTALRAALRQTPNVILLDEMRDLETIQTVLTAAETGQLLLSTLHTVGAAKTIDRIIDSFPDSHQAQIRIQLSMVLRAVVSQQLLPTVNGGLEPAFEIMVVNPAIQNIIREGKIHQMDNIIYACANDGMRTMDNDILRLYMEGKITENTAITYSVYPDVLKRKLAQLG